MKDGIGIGVEIECILNNECLSVEKGGYHHGISIDGLPKWTAENDGSLNTSGGFEWSNAIEFVSNCFKSKEKFFEALENWKKFIRKGGKELGDVVRFNNSCGCHIHLSVDKYKFTSKALFGAFTSTRDAFFKLVDENKKLSKETKNKVKKQYFRSFAQEMSESSYKSKSSRDEFNFGSERAGKGIEWRSFNLTGVKSWEEFDEMFKIAWKCLSVLYNKSVKYKKISKLNLSKEMLNKFKDKDLKREYKVPMKLYKNNKIKVNVKPSGSLLDDVIKVKIKKIVEG